MSTKQTKREKMKKINKRIIVGTKVKLEGSDLWHIVKEIHQTGKLIKVYGLMGSFQSGHILKFTNKGR